MSNWKCSYVGCKEDATTEGYVYVKEKDGLSPKFVLACDTHKKNNSFFEKAKEDNNAINKS
jgi:hypothetical protein